jgi:acyl carrier protein
LEATGAEVLVLQADVSDLAQMRSLVATTQRHFGRIDGVVHAAGIPGHHIIQSTSSLTGREVLAAKTLGTLALYEATAHLDLDFFLVCSALSAVTGGLGQVAYSAGNAYLDAFAVAKHRGQRRTISVNWDRWWNVGMAKAIALPEVLQRMDESGPGMTGQEGVEAFQLVLDSRVPRVVVSTVPVEYAITSSDRLAAVGVSEVSETVVQSRPRHARLGPYISPRNDVEARVAEVWQACLGHERIGIYDNFFDLGGHSLIGIQILSRLRRAFEIRLSMEALFGSPTVAELAAAITELVTAEIEGMAEGEAARCV